MVTRKLANFLGILCALAMLSSCSPDSTGTGTQVDTGDNDLIPKTMTFSVQYVADEEQLTVTLPIENQETGYTATDIVVHFYLSQTTAFSYLTDYDLGSVTVTDDFPGPITKNINTTLNMPDLDINKCVYIYARIDSTDLVIETNEANNESSVAEAACILLYDDEDGARTYDLVFETFPPTGVVGTNTLTALYKDNGVTMDLVDSDDDSSSYALYSKITQTCAKQSTYYLVVVAYSPGGPYALSVRSSNAAIRFFPADLGSNVEDPGENDDNPTPDPLSLPGNTALPLLSTGINVGASSNRYAAVSDWDWFEIELP